MQGQLVKITANRKLMIKIDQDTYDKLRARLLSVLKLNKFPTDRLATFELDNDEGVKNNFVTISLDKYDKQLLERKFEPLVKKPIIFQCRPKAYDFISNDEKIQGVNLELTSISLNRVKEAFFQNLKKQKEAISQPEEEDDHAQNDPDMQMIARLELQEINGTLPQPPAEQNARILPLTLIELMMKKMEDAEELPLEQPELVRQTGQIQRRRRTAVPQ